MEWRREFSLILGLERVLSVAEPKLVDGTTLSAHQVDALSGTLIALTAEQLSAQRGSAYEAGNGNGRNGKVEELPSGEMEIEGDDELSDDEEPLDWDAAEEAEEEQAADAAPSDDPGAARRFWFEHATGAGKTVAALGFVEACRTGGVLILTHRRNLVDQFNGELSDRGYKKRVRGPLLGDKDPPCDGPVTVETYQWFVRNAGKVSDAYTIVICDEAHTALGEKTSAAIRQWQGPVFVGMTATGALIARHVTDLFPTQTSRFDLAQAARRGVIAPLRCVRIPPGVGVRSISKVPLRKGEVDQDFDQEELAALLDQTPFNLAVADLYRVRFKDLPGVVYTAGVRHAHNVAEAFRDAGHQGRGRVRRDAQARAHPHPRRLRARRDRRALQRPAAGRGLELAPRHRVHAPRAHGLEAHLPAAGRPRDAPHSGQGGGHRRGLRPPLDHQRRPGRHASQPARPRRLSRRRDRGRPGAPRPRQATARGAPRAAGHRRPRAPRAGVRARAVADRGGAPQLGRAARVGGAGRRARGLQQLAPGEGDAALRLHRRAAPPLS